MLRRLRQSYPESPFAVIFDAPGKTFEATSTRITRPTGRPWIQISGHKLPAHEVIRAYASPIMVPESADDVLGTLATETAGHGWWSFPPR